MPQDRQDAQGRALRVVKQRLEDLERSGVTHVARRGKKAGAAITPAAPAVETGAASTRAASKQPAAAPHPGVAPAAVAHEASHPLSRLAQLDIIRQQVAGCTRCDELAATRTQTVFGVGDPHAQLCFLGEAPGADEDAKGEPFVGRAGQLLTKIIEACKLRREDVYILNVLKCRPPGNRNPLPHEVHNCREYLDAQLAIIQPQYICCLGTIAAHTLLETDTPIGRLRGKFVDYRGIPVLCTYHPAYLLRNPDAKKFVWDDMKLLMREMGVEL